MEYISAKFIILLYISLLTTIAVAQDYRKTVDFIIFMGQSNMAGREVVNDKHPEDAPDVVDGIAMEFRAYSDVT